MKREYKRGSDDGALPISKGGTGSSASRDAGRALGIITHDQNGVDVIALDAEGHIPGIHISMSVGSGTSISGVGLRRVDGLLNNSIPVGQSVGFYITDYDTSLTYVLTLLPGDLGSLSHVTKDVGTDMMMFTYQSPSVIDPHVTDYGFIIQSRKIVIALTAT